MTLRIGMVIAAEKTLRKEILANKAEIRHSGISSIPYANSFFDKIFTVIPSTYGLNPSRI
ncbi:MAG: hypothetical protein WD426_00770 [Anditalea sp.]